MSDKKTTGRRRVTMEVDMSWLEEVLPEAPAPPSARKRSKRPPPLPAGHAAPAPARPSKPPKHKTIEVKAEWLMPPLPEAATSGTAKHAGERHGHDKHAHDTRAHGEEKHRPPQTPHAAVPKPRGKLPPPLPREEPSPASASDRKRTSKRPAARETARPPRSKR